jgi:outer membrane protein assembly factor BamB
MPRPSCRPFGVAAVMLSCLVLAGARADDWPQWMGPGRDNVWREEGVLARFPAGGPRVVWRTPIAGGYAGPAVAQGRVFVTDYVSAADITRTNFERDASTGSERVLCLDAATGAVLWKHEYPVTYTISYPAGPRCTPVVDGDHVYTLGAEGDLLCLAVADGTVVWSRDLKQDYGTKAALWGYAGHPLVDGPRLICVAGTDVAHAVAFDKHTGQELWRAGTAPEQGYSPPTIVEHAGVRQLVFMKPDGIYAVEPETGHIIWEAAYGADNGSIIMAPVKVGEHLYVGGFQEKNLLLRFRPDGRGVETVWRNKSRHGISPVNVQPFLLDDLLWGYHEKGDLRAVAIPSGEIVWQGTGPLAERPVGSGTAFTVRQGDRVWMFTETGDLVIARLSREGYEELDRTHLLEPTNRAFGRDVVWCPPAFADRSIVVRNDREIIRVSLTNDATPAAVADPHAAVQPPTGFTALFNGRDLTGWQGLVADGNPETRAALSAADLAAAQAAADERMREHWSVVDGLLRFDGRGDNLCTVEEFGDFELLVDWKIPAGGDSGIYLRGSPQVQIWDTAFPPYFRHGAENGSGAFWNNQHHPRFPSAKADRPVGEWNTMRVRMVGERATVELNGRTVVDDVVMENLWNRSRPMFPRGPIELQNHGNELFFRHLFVRQIDAAEANAILAARGAADEPFTRLAAGRDLRGWTGAVDDYEIRDGEIICRPGRGGTLFTEREYGDFVLRHEFRLPPRGNNGLAIRYDGVGQPHLDGVEIQVLDSDHEDYAGLDPRQHHGSVYGLAAAARGYLRPAGAWNFQEVTVRGNRYRVELNGTVILDVDLDTVGSSKDGPLPPGVQRRTGRLGLIGHGDPVAFRNLMIRELPGPPAVPPDRATARTPTDGPVRLFNGENLEHFFSWHRETKYADPKRVFSVVDGMLRISGEGYGGLTTFDAWRDYHLVIEFRWGEKTWGDRVDRARDSGLLVHAWGPDGGYNGTWMASIEAQIIEGGVGDILVLQGTDPLTGRAYPVSLTAETAVDRDGETIWKRGGERRELTRGRVNWWGRDEDWKDELGFRGRQDVESPAGEWTRMDVIAAGDRLTYKVNGVVVNEALDCRPSAGRIMLQTEQAEMFVRRLELWPLGTAPE